MAQTIPITAFACPRCKRELAANDRTQPAVSCPACQWSGEAYHFRRFPADIKPAEAALPEDAACIHHPRKKAVTVCAGTGDYICSLCAIEVGGQTFSADYLNNAGKQTLDKAFDRYLPRPDSHVMTYFVCLLIPYVNFVEFAFAFLWIPHGCILYSRALRMRRENPLLRRLMGRWRMVIIPILLVLCSLLWIFGVLALIIALTSNRSYLGR